ncbi:ABC transporter ATP-binding protein [Pseudomonas entomophila]|uniref:dipeptide ABC transporter ATP-binding protein n=1 Tax=Pseudomonas entomophila TaxID=312306 RepID=UPI0023D82C53|nr:ABC transporter ATP-binding protein [Pseudomonas entomophila]MDF0729283.1 ABC transporter ATP-binding protein [Pseudomonas entomophila]
MSEALLDIQHLSIALPAGGERHHALHDLSLQVRAGECLCVVGESGSGKSMLAKALLRLLPHPLRVSDGQVRWRGRDLATFDESALRALRGHDISMVFQEPMSALNPLLSVGRQIDETLAAHGVANAAQRRARVLELLGYVGLPDPERLRHAYPFELSGGQRQRVVIAMALAFAPALLIADEPTSALDVSTQRQILDLLRRIQREQGMAMLFITHDFAVVEAIADRVLVLEKGQVVEQGTAAQVLGEPRAAYTRRLLDAVSARPAQPRPVLQGGAPVLQARQLEKHFSRRIGWWGRRTTRALAGVDLHLGEGETLGIVGESGSGKSTLGRCLVRLLRSDAGSVHWHEHDVTQLAESRLRPLRGGVQMIFQDPFASLNPRQTIVTQLMAGPLAQGRSARQAADKAREALALVGLPESALQRYPHEFSGGQRQRIGIARALAVEPKVLIADECVSALDALIQVQVLELLESLQRRLKLSIVFITHDLRVAARLCDRIAVMQAGQVVEQGATATLLARPRHAYTRTLLQGFDIQARTLEVTP